MRIVTHQVVLDLLSVNLILGIGQLLVLIWIIVVIACLLTLSVLHIIVIHVMLCHGIVPL